MKSAVVVPTNRAERMIQFIETWAPQFHKPDVRLIVVEDSPQRNLAVADWIEYYNHQDIKDRLGDKAECIPTLSGGCRDFGFWLAYQDPSIDMVVSLDDDVLPLPHLDFLAMHWIALETPQNLRWLTLFPGFPLRGEPYRPLMGKPVFNLGLWKGFPDVDAYHQLRNPDCAKTFAEYKDLYRTHLIPRGMYFPACGMNWACRREVVPYLYFPRLPEGMKRFDDIWGGLVFKRLADMYGWPVSYGPPALRHERASDPLNNLQQEMFGYALNEEMWRVLDRTAGGDSPLDGYKWIAEYIGSVFPQLQETTRLMKVWSSLFEDGQN